MDCGGLVTWGLVSPPAVIIFLVPLMDSYGFATFSERGM